MPRRVLLALLLSASLAPAAPAHALSAEAVRDRLAVQMRQAGPSSGALAVDLGSGRTLFSSRASTARIPASVNKLLVTSTALERLGPDATLDTALLSAGEIDEDGVLRGTLYLRGAADPTLTTSRIRALARRVRRETEIRSLRGGVLGDESVLDRLRGSFSGGFRLDSEVSGQLGGLVIDRGYAGGRFQTLPALYAAGRMVAALRAEGIGVSGRAGTGVTPSSAEELLSSASPPVSSLVARTNVPSDNFLAEMLLKVLSPGGSTRGGAEVVRAALARRGVSARIVDGSGLARDNRIAPSQVVRLLRSLEAGPIGGVFERSLAVAGRSGTLARRMRGTAAQGACRAKTGTLRSVSALAGFCTTRNGERVAFAFLMNGVFVPGARRLQDRMTAALAAYGS